MRYSQQEAISAIEQGEQEALLAGRYVRTKFDASEQEFVLSRVLKESPNVRKFLTGTCFAGNWCEVWNVTGLATISSSQRTLDWFVLLVKSFRSKIESHVQLRDSVNRSMLRGEWEIARDLLNRHQQEHGPTLWNLNWKIVLVEENYGFKQKSEFLKSLDGPEFGDVMPIFAAFYAYSSDQALTEEVFRKIIQNNIPKGRPITRLLELMFLDDCDENWNVSEMLDFLDFLPLIDRYELFIRLVTIGLGDGHRDSERLRRALTKISNYCFDQCTKYIVEAAESAAIISITGEGRRLVGAWDAFMVSNYSESLKMSAEVISQYPEFLSAQELYIKSLIYLNRKEEIKGNSPVAILWQNLSNVFSKNENSDDSLKYLQLFGRRFRIFSLTQPLRALCANQSSHLHDDNRFRRGSFAMLTHAPRNFEYGHAPGTNKNYLQRCLEVWNQSISFKFFYQLAAGIPVKEIKNCDEIPKIRRFFFGGLAAARMGNHEIGLAYLKGFLRLQKDDLTNPLSPFAIEEARRSLVDIYRLKGDVVSMQREVVDTFLDRPQAVRRLPMDRIFQACLEQKQLASLHIDFPIIANLSSNDPHEVYMALRRFLNSVHAGKPSDLIGANSISIRRLALLFLKVCTTEVIDSLDSLDSVSKVEAERLTLLRWVTRSSSSSASIAQKEILRLVQHIQLREALEKIDGARVVVNVAALREAEAERFRDIYLRFVALREVATSKANDQLTDLLNTIATLEIPKGKVILIDSDSLRPERENTLKAFAAAFSEVRHTFIYSAHFGIEASLSGRIRHGIVVQHIRKPFVERRLAVLKDSLERGEVENYWQARIGCDSKTNMERVMEVLFALTTEINGITESKGRQSFRGCRTYLRSNFPKNNSPKSRRSLSVISSLLDADSRWKKRAGFLNMRNCKYLHLTGW